MDQRVGLYDTVISSKRIGLIHETLTTTTVVILQGKSHEAGRVLKFKEDIYALSKCEHFRLFLRTCRTV